MALTAGQQRCVDTLDQPLVVAAGAGSGKTFTLTKRIVGAFKSGFVGDIGEVCAITFTTKAAGELKSRIKAELRSSGYIDQALLVDEAWISTIHGMCARILRAHAVELGIDPAFKVAEGPQVDTYRASAIDQVLIDAQLESSPRLDALFAEYPARSYGGFGVSVEGMLSDLLDDACSQTAGAEAIVMPGVTIGPLAIVEQACEAFEAVLEAACGEKASATRDEWIASASEALDAAREACVQGIENHSQALRIISPFKLVKTFGSKEYRARVEQARSVVGACAMEARLGVAQHHLETLVDLTKRALDVFAALKHADGVLDNNDLLVLAARAIEDYPDIAAHYADKFKLVMVDEFQDTDQMQVDMIKRLAGEGACRLCVVGDAQQSIYRFRGADVSVYRHHVASVQDDVPDSVIELADNFRSHADVLAFVDCVFEKPDMFGGEFMSLAPGRDEAKVNPRYADDQPRITIQHTTRPSRGVSSERVVTTAAQRIAEEFSRLVQAGHAPSEMAVLLGRMTNADVYAQALRDKGLACVVSGGSVFSSTMEAHLACQLVRVLANPGESQALFNVLTSSMFALTAGDLLATDGVAGFWHMAYDTSASPASPQLACAMRTMVHARESIGVIPLWCIMEHIMVESDWLSRLQSEGAEGLASAANAYKAIRIVREIESSGAVGPASVAMRFAEELAASKEAPGALSVSGGDSVKIMTIHASKGLEFPIVAVAEIKEDRAVSSRLITSAVEGNVYVSLDVSRTLEEAGDTVDPSTFAGISDYVLGLRGGEAELAEAVMEDAGALHRRLALREYATAGDAEEGKRLLYVALTRAKEALVISSTGVRTKDNPSGLPKNALAGMFNALDGHGEGFGEGRSCCPFGGSQPAIVECVELKSDDDISAESSVGQGDDRPLFMVPTSKVPPVSMREVYKPARQGVFSYSSIAEASHEGDFLVALADAFAVSVDEAAESNDEFDCGADAFRTRDVTSFVEDDFWDYAVVVRDDPGALAMPPTDRVEALSRTCNLDNAQRARLDDALNRWFASDVANGMAQLPHLSAEVPFFVAVATPEQEAYLEGEIDLLGFDDDRKHATVIDYKTGGRNDESCDELRCKHVLQAACYAYAIMLQGATDVEAVFVRVERPRSDDMTQPQCVRYRFSQADLFALKQAIAEAYGKALQ